MREGLVAADGLVGKPSVAPIVHVLRPEVEASHVVDRQIHSSQFVARRDPVLKADESLVGGIGDIALCFGDGQEGGFQRRVGLQVRCDFYEVVVGHD